MSRLSYRAVDFAIKSYRLGSPEFCRHVRKGEGKLHQLRQKITDLCHKLLHENRDLASKTSIEPAVDDAQVRLVQSALRICRALHAAYDAAEEIAHRTMVLLEDGQVTPSAALERACFLVNRLMCLCIVALFKKESRYADAVLQSNNLNGVFEQVYHGLRNEIGARITIPAAIEQTIARSLQQIAGQTGEIAEAIVFWLEGTNCVIESCATASL
jgi:phosphate uptake regulator